MKSDVFWFLRISTAVLRRPSPIAHAFRIVDEQLAPRSACGGVDVEDCDDEPLRDESNRVPKCGRCTQALGVVDKQIEV